MRRRTLRFKETYFKGIKRQIIFFNSYIYTYSCNFVFALLQTPFDISL